MTTRILVTCFEPPGWGGASTATYALFETMKAHDLDATYVSLVAEDDLPLLRRDLGSELGNPRGLPDVHTCILRGTSQQWQREVENCVSPLRPDVILAAGSAAVQLLRSAAPATPLTYLLTGCEQLKTLIVTGEISDLTALERHARRPAARYLGLPARSERLAMGSADLVVTNSDAVLFLMDYFFPRLTEKIHRRPIWFTEWICAEARKYASLAKEFSRREIDVLFVASSWSRPEKNYRFVRKLIPLLRGRKLHIVGHAGDRLSGATYHGLLQRDSVFELMGNAKAVACVSSFDAAPGVLFEASVMGSNVVASRNCGNWRLCPEELLVDPFTVEAFAAAINLSVTREFQDNLSALLNTESYEELQRLLTLLPTI